MPSRFTRTRARTERARRLRRDMTEIERKLWLQLRQGQAGATFRRQHPLGRYVIDFYAPSLKLAIECDGGQHAQPQNKLHDGARTAWLERRDVLVLRYWNNDIVSNIDGVVQDIASVIAKRKQTLTEKTTPRHPPLSGEGDKPE